MFRSGEPTDPMPWAMAVFLALFLAGAGLILLEVGRRAAAGRLRRNQLVGIRTSLTLDSDTAWDAAHRAGGRLIALSGLGPLVSGPTLLTHPTNGAGLAIVLAGIGWMVAWVLAAGVVGTRAAEAAVEAGGE